MKKLSLLLLAAVFSLSIYSCRETTEEKTEDVMEEMDHDMGEATEESVEVLEVEAVEETADVNADQE